MRVALVGEGPCVRDLECAPMLYDEYPNGVATMNGAIRRLDGPRWAMMQDPTMMELYSHYAAPHTRVLYGILTHMAVQDPPRWKYSVYSNRYHQDPPKLDIVRDAVKRPNTELFSPVWYRWAPDWWTPEWCHCCPHDVAILFALAFFGEMEPDARPESIDLYGVDLDRPADANGRGILLDKFLPEFPIPVRNGCPSSALANELEPVNG